MPGDRPRASAISLLQNPCSAQPDHCAITLAKGVGCAPGTVGQIGRDHAISGRHPAHGGRRFLARPVLPQAAATPASSARRRSPGRPNDGDDEHPHRKPLGLEARAEVQPRAAGQIDVREQYIGPFRIAPATRHWRRPGRGPRPRCQRSRTAMRPERPAPWPGLRRRPRGSRRRPRIQRPLTARVLASRCCPSRGLCTDLRSLGLPAELSGALAGLACSACGRN